MASGSPSEEPAALRDVSVLIKTFLRPESVRRVVQSFSKVLGDSIPILVVDDSPEPDSSGFPSQVTLIPMPFDSGVSAGRNRGVDSVTTSRVILADDDCLLESSLEEVLQCLDLLDQGWDLVGSGAHDFDVRDGVLQVIERPVSGPVRECCCTKNFFVAKTELLRIVPWDSRMKTRPEHADHFLRLQQFGAKIGGTHLLRFRNLGWGSPAYRRMRSRNYLDLFREKWGWGDVVWRKHNGAASNAGTRWFAPDETRRLHVSCGRNCLSGWLNVGRPSGEGWVHRCELGGRLPFAENTFDFVYMDRVIERFSYVDGRRLLRELWRVLRPGARIRVATFNLDFLVQLGTKQPATTESAYLKWSMETFLKWASSPDPILLLNHHMRSMGHRFLYAESTLTDLMEITGFAGVETCISGESRTTQLRMLEDERRLPDGYYRLETLILEASKPS